jgi:hypothetical protein
MMSSESYLKMLADTPKLPEAWLSGSFGVSDSADLHRVLQLPRREIVPDLVPDLTPVFRRPGGTMTMRWVQSAALLEGALRNGLLAPVGVGWGKTLIALLLASAMDSTSAVILIPAEMRHPYARAIEFYDQHFYIPRDRFYVATYEELSTENTSELLDLRQPDLIIADEAHCLSNRDSARTMRFDRYMRDNQACRFAGMSGTITRKSINDYHKLLIYALRGKSPLPLNYREAADWASAIDAKPRTPIPAGALVQLCAPGETVREGYRRRLRQTAGVIRTEEGAIDTSLVLRRVPIQEPPELVKMLAELDDAWCLDGEYFESILTYTKARRQLSCGFYYRWNWPDGIPDTEWLEARANWNRFVRQVLSNSKKGLESPKQVARACERHEKWLEKKQQKKDYPKLAMSSEEWRAWKVVKGRWRPAPPTIGHWVCDYAMRAVIERAKVLAKEAPTIIWSEHVAVCQGLAAITKYPYYGADTDAETATARIIICGTRSQATGKNLQRYARNLLVSMPSGGKVFEQLVGRTHRPGQLHDEVVVEWLAPSNGVFDAALASCIEDAKYVEETTGLRQKVLYATQTSLGVERKKAA